MSYWITQLNTGSTKSPYSIRFTLNDQPINMAEISAWLLEAFGKNGYLLKLRIIRHMQKYILRMNPMQHL